MDKLLKHVGANIKKLREDMGLTQDELAGRTAKNKSSISNLENGRGNPALSSLYDIAEALGVKVWELFRPKDEKPGYPAALLEFQQYMNTTKRNINHDEMQFLKLLKVGGKSPQEMKTYLLSWLLLRLAEGKDLPDFLNLEISKVDGDIVGTFKVHMG